MSLRLSILRDKQNELFALAQWEKISGYLHSWSAGFLTGLKVYQDGLPDTSEDNLNKIFAQAPGRNYRILRWLKSEGAVIMGTENTQLLLEEYRFLTGRYYASDEESWARATLEYVGRREQLLADRDTYIAQRIDNTLMPGEAGLLFIGLAHNIKPLLVNKMKLGEPGIFSSDRLLAKWGKEIECRNI
ncbi:hypothetical protein A3C26_03685 [Candidatus Daviesbacteria bacterium RIFCSPHIGHO2_02_FULL_39_12]|uniref:Uncharacterized protein n=2 Tax=Candidatus Daviesiibacteriota TaxID=1752718 RepID=A0A1F5JC89_9BACT|nr:MAG: hypothetical protein A3C26_03685 [Candidatus Daviesbacteria bacterium RIFCSPHIGHO2_02_FULL_39_12]OGE71642.1 MAG: hypothetical protein A3H40_01380 [Candidatus Daviesbacteria bacterium RIFCSPLOWO2_02_FULL_38_15]